MFVLEDIKRRHDKMLKETKVDPKSYTIANEPKKVETPLVNVDYS